MPPSEAAQKDPVRRPRQRDGTVRLSRRGLQRPPSRRLAAQIALPQAESPDTARGSSLFDPVNDMTDALAEQLAAFQDTDVGNAERLALLYGDRIRYSPGRGWLIYDGRRWCHDRADEVQRYAVRTLRALQAAAARLEDKERVRALTLHALRSEQGRRPDFMLERARSAQEVRNLIVPAEQLDANPDLLNVANGTVDLRTGKLRPHDPADLITKISPIPIDPECPTPIWDNFIKTVSADDPALVEFKRTLYGYAATGNTSEQMLFIAHGNGANGKTTELETIAEALGDYAATAAFDTFAGRTGQTQRFGLAHLQGARFVRASEGDDGARLSEGLVKLATGGEKIPAEFKGKDQFFFQPQFTPFLITNHLPIIQGNDDGIWRRVQDVPYRVTIPPEKQDKNLRAKLAAELPGILAWIVRGASDWYREGLKIPDAITQANEAYRTEMDHLGRFLGEVTTTKAGASIRSSDLYAAYGKWCAIEDLVPVTQVKFSKELKGRGFKPKRGSTAVLWQDLALAPVAGVQTAAAQPLGAVSPIDAAGHPAPLNA